MKTQAGTPSRRGHWLASQLNLNLPALALALLAFGSPAKADDDDRQRRQPPELPSPFCDHVNVPAGHRVSSQVYALGVQIYRWSGMNWAFIAPEAALFANPCYERQVGMHCAGPTWEANDGSKVTGARLAGCIPYRGAIP